MALAGAPDYPAWHLARPLTDVVRHRRTGDLRHPRAIVIAIASVGLIGSTILGYRLIRPTQASAPQHVASVLTSPTPDLDVATRQTSTEAPAPTTPTPAPQPPTPPGPAAIEIGTLPVARTTLTLVDPSRSTMARGTRPAVGTRTLTTTVRYPQPTSAATADSASADTTNSTSAELATATSTHGPFPLVIFAEGFDISADRYEGLLDGLASAGYVVAAPEFPMTSSTYPGEPVESDLVNQPADVSFVLSSLLEANGAPGALQGLIAPSQCAVVGHSDGAFVAAALGFNPPSRDRRFSAIVILSGQSGDIRSGAGLEDSPPVLFAHGTEDEFNRYSIAEELYGAVAPPRYLLTIPGGRHLEPFTTDPIRPAVTAVVANFLDLRLRGISASAQRLAESGNAPGLSLRSQTP